MTHTHRSRETMNVGNIVVNKHGCMWNVCVYRVSIHTRKFAQNKTSLRNARSIVTMRVAQCFLHRQRVKSIDRGTEVMLNSLRLHSAVHNYP